ncbi:MAG TPA: hypothetical protein VFU15_10035 [Bacteroidia bacterium]|nr:hypothetical protein [Bacteroidia bacterium]
MLKKVITQISDEDYSAFHAEISGNKAEKFTQLLELYRETDKDEDDIRKMVSGTPASFYTLKSRLFDKLRAYLFRTTADERGDLMKNISSLPKIANGLPRETAISLLEQLEAELKTFDMPRELISVYSALQRLHLNDDSYYQYQQLYNKTVAYALARDKSDEVASLLNREICHFLLSADATQKEIIKLRLKELRNLSALYDSHRLKMNVWISSLTYALFVDDHFEIPGTTETAEDLLGLAAETLKTHADVPYYHYVSMIWHFLNAEYYRRLGLKKNAAESFGKVNAAVSSFLLLAHTCPASAFLLSRAERLGKDDEHISGFHPAPEDPFTMINVALHHASVDFHKGKYADAASMLNQLCNEVSFKNFPFAECQVKLFLGLSFALAEKSDQAELVVRSITRKLATEEYAGRFESAKQLGKFLKIAANDTSNSKKEKLEQAWQSFSLVNKGPEAVLTFLKTGSEHIALLSK